MILEDDLKIENDPRNEKDIKIEDEPKNEKEIKTIPRMRTTSEFKTSRKMKMTPKRKITLNHMARAYSTRVVLVLLISCFPTLCAPLLVLHVS